MNRWGFAAWYTFTSSGLSIRLTGPQHRELDPLLLLKLGLQERDRLHLEDGKVSIAEWVEDGRYPR